MGIVLALGLLVWAIKAAGTGETDNPRIGVGVAEPVLRLLPGDEACQTPIDLDDQSLSLLGVGLVGGEPPGAPMRVEVRDAATREVLATGRVPKGWTLPPLQYFGMELSERVEGDRTIEVCGRNVGRRKIELFGNQAIINGRVNEDTGADWAVFFPLPEDERRTWFGMLGDIVSRAAVLRPNIVTPALYVALALVLFVGGPLLLLRAVRRAADDG